MRELAPLQIQRLRRGAIAGNKDGVSHQCPPCRCRTKAHLHRLESGGSFQRPPSTCGGGGQSGPAGHDDPEKKAPSLADRSTVTAPHRGGKWFLYSGLFFFLRRALRGWAGWGQVWGSSWWGRVRRHIGMSQQTCMRTDTVAPPPKPGCSVSTGLILIKQPPTPPNHPPTPSVPAH